VTAAMPGTAPVVAFGETGPLVPCQPGETILLAGLRAGVPLTYECASGGCGSCRAQLVSGSVTPRWPQAPGLTERDRRRGNRILMCQSLPDGPCQVRAPQSAVTGAAAEPRPRRLPGQVSKREMLTDDTAQFIVEAGGDLPYLAGQFVIIEFSDGVRRAYSMSRPACLGDPRRLELLIRAKPGGAGSRWLFAPQWRALPVTVEGPYGRAYARLPATRPAACLAGGTGLAPVLAIAEELAAAGGHTVEVYVGVRQAQDLVLAARLTALRDRGVLIVPVVETGQDQDEHPELGPLRAGLALDHLATDRPDLSGHDLYIAGPAPMIDATLRRLVRQGTAVADRTFFDRFIA
jgi:NAD(P)H-flavin reductase/ferredoxin